jgi:hypothetical protein
MECSGQYSVSLQRGICVTNDPMGHTRSTGDDRASSALFMLEGVRALQLFTTSYRSTGSDTQSENAGKSRQHSYDISESYSHDKFHESD